MAAATDRAIPSVSIGDPVAVPDWLAGAALDWGSPVPLPGLGDAFGPDEAGAGSDSGEAVAAAVNAAPADFATAPDLPAEADEPVPPADASTDPVTGAVLPVIDPAMRGGFQLTNTETGVSGGNAGEAYAGPVHFLDTQLIWTGTQGVAMVATMPNAFLHGGAGDDALVATAGSNVLDGGDGTNFLVGATGADGGTDTFFVDAGTPSRSPIVSTLVNFHAGDTATIWGFQPGVSTARWVGVTGVKGYSGATLQAEIGGRQVSVIFAGYSEAEAEAALSTGTGVAEGRTYMTVTRAS